MVESTPMRIPVPLPYDAEIEYLESTNKGSQYIKLGEYGLGVKVVIDAKGDVKKVETQVAVGIDDSDGAYLGGVPHSKDNKWGIGKNKGMYIDSPDFLNRVVSEISFNESQQAGTIDGRSVSSKTSLKETIWYAFGLEKVSYFIGKIYSIKFYDKKEAIIADLIPVRLGQVGYLYDKISGSMYSNGSQTGFVLGNDK